MSTGERTMAGPGFSSKSSVTGSDSSDFSVALTYRGLVKQIAQVPPEHGFTSVDDLPKLTLEHLGAVLTHYPLALLEAIDEFEPTCTDRTRAFLADTTLDEDDRAALIGTVFVCALRQSVMPIVLRDVQIAVENNILFDNIERDSLTREVLTVDQFTACELGLGRTFS